MTNIGKTHHLPALMTYGFFVVSIFHNVANQITQLQCELQKAAPHLPLHTYRELQNQLNYVADVIRHSQEILGKDRPNHQCFCVTRLLWKTKQLCNLMFMRYGVQCRIQSESHLCLQADPVIVQQMLLNLLHNSLEALENCPNEQKVIELRTHRQAQFLVIEVKDHGPGMPDQLVTQVGEPFCTAKSNGTGHGLGLAYIKHHMESSFGGQCQVSSKMGKGTVVSLFFPLQPKPCELHSD